MAIAWTSDLNTGIDVIDNQHKEIVNFINQLEDAIAKSDPTAVGNVLAELVNYTLSHFAFEESMQEEAGYKFSKPHKAIHDVFVKRVAQYQEKHALGEDVTEGLHSMLCTWLVHHIKRDDMAYVNDVKKLVADKSQNEEQKGWLTRSIGKFFK